MSQQATAEKAAGGAAPTSSKQSVADDVAHDKELFEDVLTGNVSRETPVELMPVPGATFAEIPIDYIVSNTRQPREIFDEDDLVELSASIKEVGVLQPVVVRPIQFEDEPNERLKEYLEEKPGARFELIMGERRTRASELAGETTIPAIIRSTEDEDLLRDALLENLHRVQLNPLEEASAYQQLMADFGATQEELAKRIARSRPQIANTLRLLKLPPVVQKKVAAQVISAGHARALLSLNTAEEMERLAERIVAEGLSVRTTEELVRLGRVKAAPKPRLRSSAKISELGERVVNALQDAYDTRVTITEGRTKGKIVIEFAGPEDLQRLADVIMPTTK
ncbi:ParB/RepB/Spo0J family partition protein [Schaalia vaccimaxillae]|uniref:ParB/RepB/Spo0J family partition protein n=1 Tax=Schaalia vaccimaxillae TaxID=183916 RepID=UPI003C788AED